MNMNRIVAILSALLMTALTIFIFAFGLIAIWSRGKLNYTNCLDTAILVVFCSLTSFMSWGLWWDAIECETRTDKD